MSVPVRRARSDGRVQDRYERQPAASAPLPVALPGSDQFLTCSRMACDQLASHLYWALNAAGLLGDPASDSDSDRSRSVLATEREPPPPRKGRRARSAR